VRIVLGFTISVVLVVVAVVVVVQALLVTGRKLQLTVLADVYCASVSGITFCSLLLCISHLVVLVLRYLTDHWCLYLGVCCHCCHHSGLQALVNGQAKLLRYRICFNCTAPASTQAHTA
jgi:hypothetical protein